MKKKLLSIGISCYNEEENVEHAYTLLKKFTQRIRTYNFEYVFVDNGSLDKTRIKIHYLVTKDHSVRGIYLSRNFGPEASSQASFDFSKGDAVIWYPGDNQEPAELIPQLIKKWEEGYDSVVGIYTKLEDPWFMALLRKGFYRIMKYISDIDIPINSSGYGLYSRKVVSAMASLPETFRFERGIRAWIGFSTAYILYERRKRMYGKSSYSLMSYFQHAQRSIFGFSYLPLDLLIYFGLILVLLSFFFIIGYIFFFFLFGNPIKGAVTILVAIVFFGGVNLLALSIIGKYIQVIVEETKARPTYIVDQKWEKGKQIL
jgi:glycosyltransferase involved in cell wall biosynthesis